MAWSERRWRLARAGRASVLAALATFVLAVLPAAAAGAQGAPTELRPGGRGPAVRRLWTILHALHYLDGPATAPRRYGAALALALHRFEWVNGLPVDSDVGPALWRDLAAARLHDRALAPDAPEWLVVVREALPESASVYEDGRLVVRTAANTGVEGAQTPLGVFFVYEKLRFQVMRGVDVNGSRYADPVHDIWYFDGGDAFHGFVRAAYGFPQSNGCVEVPPTVAASLFPRMPVGTEVDVIR
jgi:hypothetical protein